MNRIIIRNIKGLRPAAKKLIGLYPQNRLFAFYGAMGSGKTTIIKAVCEHLGAVDPVSSPTFTIVNEYRSAERGLIYHIDFYRIKKPGEVFDFGIEEYFADGSYCFMEWPELIENILPAQTVRIKITVGENQERILTEG